MRFDPLPGALPASHRRWILVNAVTISAVVNLALNAGIAWASATGRTDIPLWATPLIGGPSTITDTVGTFFLLPFITCLLVTTAVRRDQHRGVLTRLPDARTAYPALSLLPPNRATRGVLCGALCVAALEPPALPILIATNFGHLSVTGFVAYKAILGVVLGAVVTPAIALCAMADTQAMRH
jgi:hypothetical protein